MLNWYALTTKHGQEENTENALLARQYETYLPLTFKDKRKSRYPKSLITEPMFPCYTFVRLNEGKDDFYPVSKVPGVVGIVKLTIRDGYKHPTPVPPGVIIALQQTENENGVHAIKFDYQCHDPIRIKAGPFKDQIAKIHSVRSSQRVIALLSIMGGEHKIELDYRQIQPIS